MCSLTDVSRSRSCSTTTTARSWLIVARASASTVRCAADKARGGLVGEQDLGLAGERPGQLSQPLRLQGHPVDGLRAEVADAEALQGGPGPLPGRRRLGLPERSEHPLAGIAQAGVGNVVDG